MNELDDETQVPPPNIAASTPGTFAAAWNARSDEERQAFLDGVHDARMRADQCWAQQHERIDEFRTALIRIELLLSERARQADESLIRGFYGDPFPARLTVAEVRAAIEGKR